MSKTNLMDQITEILEVTGGAKPGAISLVVVEHEKHCPAAKTQRTEDCICCPLVAMERVK